MEKTRYDDCGSCEQAVIVHIQFLSSLPGPGNYGKDGVPSRLIEESSKRSPGMVGMLDCGGRNIRIQSTVVSRQYTYTYTHTYRHNTHRVIHDSILYL